jgi:hypothetical protein
MKVRITSQEVQEAIATWLGETHDIIVNPQDIKQTAQTAEPMEYEVEVSKL